MPPDWRWPSPKAAKLYVPRRTSRTRPIFSTGQLLVGDILQKKSDQLRVLSLRFARQLLVADDEPHRIRRHVSQHPQRAQREPLQAGLQQVSGSSIASFTPPYHAMPTDRHHQETLHQPANTPLPPATTPKMAPSCATSTPAGPSPRPSRRRSAPTAATRSSSTTCRR